jgi:hypothetical protein
MLVLWGDRSTKTGGCCAVGSDLQGRILGCGDGPASFNADATARGLAVVSCDPLYHWDTADIRARIAATSPTVLAETRKNADEFVWTDIRSVDELGEIRMAAMERFLDDYPTGRTAGRYVEAALPDLPFADAHFDLALCSRFLFLYTAQPTAPFAIGRSLELSAGRSRVRIFAPSRSAAARSDHVDGVVVSSFALPVMTWPWSACRRTSAAATEMLGSGGRSVIRRLLP